MKEPIEPLAMSEKYADVCHERWRKYRNRDQASPNYKDEWYGQQCGACLFFIRLTGVLSTDYGGCTNPASSFDARVMYEHDGCEQFEADEAWNEQLPECSIDEE